MNKQQIGNVISLILKQLKDEVCTQIHYSYGDELILDFGELSNHTHPKLNHLQKGEWQLGFRASEWKFFKDGKFKTSSNILHENKDLLHLIVNNKLTDVVIDQETFKCTLKFENNFRIEIECDLESNDDLAHFELFMPEHKYLSFGPKLDWEYKSSLSKV